MGGLKNKVSGFLNRNTLKPKDRKPLCAYPFMNVMLTADGRYKPCCKWTETLSDKGEQLRLPEAHLDDAFHSSEMAGLRRSLLNGKRHPGCKVCWDEDDSGIRSMRHDSFAYRTAQDPDWNAPRPGRLDIYPGNICNLKCRICSPHYSSRWIEEARDTQGIHEGVHMNLDSRNMALIEKWLPQIEEIGLFGGEPLYLKEGIRLIERCVEQGHSSRLRLLINTNGTVYTEHLMELFRSFSKVLLNFSIDDLGERFEYQRKGAKWKEVVSHIDRYVAEGGVHDSNGVQCKMCCTVSAFNVFYLPEYLEWVTGRYPGMEVFLNVLHGPYSLSIRNLPQGVKEVVRDRLKNYCLRSEGNRRVFLHRDVQSVIDFLNSPAEHPSDWFMKEVRRGDRYRRERFENVFPEYSMHFDLTNGC